MHCYCFTHTLSTRTGNDVSPGKDAVSLLHPERGEKSTHPPPESHWIEASREPPTRSVKRFRVAIGDTGNNWAFQRSMTQITHKTGAPHADTSLGGVGWCWEGGEEIPPPLTRTVIVSWLLQRRHLVAVWREKCVGGWPAKTNKVDTCQRCYCTNRPYIIFLDK